MVEKIKKRKVPAFDKGDLLEVVTEKGKFKCVVVEGLNGGFIGRVIDKDDSIGVTSWDRYGLQKNARIQPIDECVSVKKLAESKKTRAKSTLELNESIQKSDLSYYETKIDKDLYVTFCESEGYGGWSIHDQSTSKEALKESFLDSQISKIQANA